MLWNVAIVGYLERDKPDSWSYDIKPGSFKSLNYVTLTLTDYSRVPTAVFAWAFLYFYLNKLTLELTRIFKSTASCMVSN